MLDDFLTAFENFGARTDPAFHIIQRPLFCNPGNPPAAGFLLGALGTHQTAAACGRGVIADVTAPFMALKTEGQAFAGRAEVAIAAADVAEIILGEESLLFISSQNHCLWQ